MERLPAQHVAGTTLAFVQALPDYPAPTWALSFALVNATGRRSFSSTPADNGRHAVTVSASACAAWAAGRYDYQAYVTNGTEVRVIESGSIQILPNFAAATGGLDTRSPARRILDAINALLAGIGDDTAKRVRWGDRELESFGTDELLRLRSRMQQEVSREDAAASGQSRSQNIKIRFGRP